MGTILHLGGPSPWTQIWGLCLLSVNNKQGSLQLTLPQGPPKANARMAFTQGLVTSLPGGLPPLLDTRSLTPISSLPGFPCLTSTLDSCS